MRYLKNDSINPFWTGFDSSSVFPPGKPRNEQNKIWKSWSRKKRPSAESSWISSASYTNRSRWVRGSRCGVGKTNSAWRFHWWDMLFPAAAYKYLDDRDDGLWERYDIWGFWTSNNQENSPNVISVEFKISLKTARNDSLSGPAWPPTTLIPSWCSSATPWLRWFLVGKTTRYRCSYDFPFSRPPKYPKKNHVKTALEDMFQKNIKTSKSYGLRGRCETTKIQKTIGYWSLKNHNLLYYSTILSQTTSSKI